MSVGEDEYARRKTEVAPALHAEGGAVVLAVAVIPRAPKNEVCGIRAGRLLVKVTAAPEKGKANRAVVDIIAEYLGVAPSTLTVLRGESARHKDILLQKHP